MKAAIKDLKTKGEAALKALLAAVHAEVNRARTELPIVASRLAHDMERELVAIVRGLKAGLADAVGEASKMGSEAIRVMENGLKEIHTLIDAVAARVKEVADKALTEMKTVAESVANSARTAFEKGLSDAERIVERIVAAVKKGLKSIFASAKKAFVEVKEKIESGFSDIRADIEGEIHKLESHVSSSKAGGAISEAFEEAGHIVEVGTATALHEAETAGKVAIDGMEDIVKDGSSLINVSTISIAVYYFLAAAVFICLIGLFVLVKLFGKLKIAY